MNLQQRVVAWWRRRKAQRRALALLDELFRTPDLLRGTSLESRHARRWVYVDHEADAEGVITRVRFGIVRHPRPYAFSAQSHKVAEYYTYEVTERRVSRERGVNITRAEGRDAD